MRVEEEKIDISIVLSRGGRKGRTKLTDRIDTADDHVPQIRPIPPVSSRIVVLRRNDPGLSLLRQTIQDPLSKRPVGNLVLQQQTLLFSSFALDSSERSNEVTFRVARVDVPTIDGDEDLLREEERSLSSS